MKELTSAGDAGKRNVTNRFEAVRCQACGRSVARKSRQQRYCSDRCRDFEKGQRRVRKSWPGAVSIDRDLLRKILRAEIGDEPCAPGS